MVHRKKGAHTAFESGTPGNDLLILSRWSRKTESYDRLVIPLIISGVFYRDHFTLSLSDAVPPSGKDTPDGFGYVSYRETCLHL